MFQDKITARFKGQTLFMTNIEAQIAYKRYIAKSEKDMADARHLELVFQGLKFDAMIEDQFKGLSGLPASIVAILLTQPWNRREHLPQGVLRMNGWPQIAAMLLTEPAQV